MYRDVGLQVARGQLDVVRDDVERAADQLRAGREDGDVGLGRVALAVGQAGAVLDDDEGP